MTALVVTADTVVTLDGATVHEPGFVAIEDGIVADVGSGRPGGDVADLGSRIIMPGLVNAHTHTPMILFRGVSEGRSLLTLDGWYDTIRTLELHLTPELVPAAVELSCAEMIAAGTTGLADQYFFADRVAEGIRHAGLRATVAYGIVELGDNTARATELDRAAAFLRTSGHDPLVQPWLGPHAFFVDNTEEAIAAEVALADEFGVGLHAHFSTTGEEDALCLERHGTTALQRLAELGVLDRPVVLAHCLQLDDDDLDLLASSPVVVVLVASVAMASGAAAPRLRRLLDAGVTVAIGTDNMANNGSHDLFEEMRTLSRLSAFVESTPGVVTSDEMLGLACGGGAAALGSHGGGRLAAGADADLISLDPRRLARGPSSAQSLTSAIVWGGSAGAVADVMVGGRWLQRDGRQLTVDRESAWRQVDSDFAELLARRAGTRLTRLGERSPGEFDGVEAMEVEDVAVVGLTGETDAGRRSNERRNEICSSRRASGAPTQKWMPAPKLTLPAVGAERVELVGTFEASRVAVGGAEHHTDLLTRRDSRGPLASSTSSSA